MKLHQIMILYTVLCLAINYFVLVVRNIVMLLFYRKLLIQKVTTQVWKA